MKRTTLLMTASATILVVGIVGLVVGLFLPKTANLPDDQYGKDSSLECGTFFSPREFESVKIEDILDFDVTGNPYAQELNRSLRSSRVDHAQLCQEATKFGFSETLSVAAVIGGFAGLGYGAFTLLRTETQLRLRHRDEQPV